MIDAGAKVLVVEAGKTLLVDRAKVIKMADEHGIAIVAINR
jgi:UDP-2,3-diacylglucosamine hydrolase